MKRILSIDWDYFINATALQRGLLFPDGGNENLSYALQDLIWDSRYSCGGNEDLRSIGVLKNDYSTVSNLIHRFTMRYLHSGLHDSRMLVCISHKWIYNFVNESTTSDEEFELYNVDFHHDMYDLKVGDEEVNCGNWVNYLFKSRPNMQYFWVKREDSDTEVLGGESVHCNMRSIDDLQGLKFDYIFICRSDCWSPPHLDFYFKALWVKSIQYTPVRGRATGY